jgi:hypothetical protein
MHQASPTSSRKPSKVSTLQQLTHAVGAKHHAALHLALTTQWSMDCEWSAVALRWAHHVTIISLQTQPRKKEGCYTGCTRDYVATEPSHGRIQPVREGEPSGQTPPLKACIARSACSQIFAGNYSTLKGAERTLTVLLARTCQAVDGSCCRD